MRCKIAQKKKGFKIAQLTKYRGKVQLSLTLLTRHCQVK